MISLNDEQHKKRIKCAALDNGGFVEPKTQEQRKGEKRKIKQLKKPAWGFPDTNKH